MTYWIEPYDLNGDYYLGSDGCIRLDGRFGLNRAIEEGSAYCRQLRHVKSIRGFRLSKGVSCLNLTPLHCVELPREGLTK